MKINKYFLRPFLWLCLLNCTTLVYAANRQNITDTKVSIKQKNTRLADIFSELDSRTDFDFAYGQYVLDKKERYDAVYRNTPLDEILKNLSEEANFKYNIKGNTILIAKDDGSYKLGFQQTNVKGTITDETGQPLPGASIVEKGTANGVSTDFDGNYTIEVSSADAVLEISYLGYTTQEVPINGQTAIDAQLQPDAGQLDEVVVTALGITKEEKSIGFSVQEVNNENLTNVNSSNWSNALNGRVAGLNLTKSASLASSTRVVLRGESSLNLDNNQALFVVDGVPITNIFTPSSGKGQYSAEPDFGNGINELNPDDIESVSVLKGPSAAALYGSRAANGVVMITTKSASRNQKGLGIGYSSTLLMETVNRWPDYQYEYGAGGVGKEAYYSFGNSEDGPSTANSGYNWGPKFDGQEFVQLGSPLDENGERIKIPWRPYKDNIKGFFNTGITDIKSISFSGRNDIGSFRLGYTNMKKKGIVPNNELVRNSFSLNTGYAWNEKLNVDVVANYVNSNSDNITSSGYDSRGGIMYHFIWQERNLSLDWLRDYWVKGKEGLQQKQIFSWASNPYFAVNEVLNGFNKDRLFGNIKTTYTFNTNLDLMLRAGTDFYHEDRTFRAPFSTVGFPFGYFRTQKIYARENNFDFLINFTKELGKDFDLNFSFGGNIRKQFYDFQEAFAQELAIPEVYGLENARSRPSTTAYFTDKKVNSLYGFGQISFRDMIFLEFTGRNDWSSTLPIDNNSYFYPSVNSSIFW